MDKTANLELPYIIPSQAQKSVTHNEALRRLDALVMLSVESRTFTNPPPAVAEGDRYIVAAGAGGDWTGKDNHVAAWQDGGWIFLAPRDGWLAWCSNEANLLCHSGGAWSTTNAITLENVPHLGVNATPDDTNRLVVSAPATLFTESGSDHRLVINKKTEADTASIVFQNGFSGRAEIGLAGDDRFSLKVSGDGGAFSEALGVDPQTGKVSFAANSFLESFALNLYQDAGRFSASSAGGLTVGAFAWPAYLTLNNGANSAGYGKFVYDNSDYGGAGAALLPHVRDLVEWIRDPGYRRYNIEFWVAQVTAGSGTTSSPLVVGADTGYLSLFTSFIVRPPAVTFHTYLKALDDVVLIKSDAGQVVRKNGVLQASKFAIAPSDGWVSLTVHDAVDPRRSYGYQPTAFSVYAKTAGDRYLVACPALVAGLADLSDSAGVIASINSWPA